MILLSACSLDDSVPNHIQYEDRYERDPLTLYYESSELF